MLSESFTFSPEKSSAGELKTSLNNTTNGEMMNATPQLESNKVEQRLLLHLVK
jgi:hypothetical protein